MHRYSILRSTRHGSQMTNGKGREPLMKSHFQLISDISRRAEPTNDQRNGGYRGEAKETEPSPSSLLLTPSCTRAFQECSSFLTNLQEQCVKSLVSGPHPAGLGFIPVSTLIPVGAWGALWGTTDQTQASSVQGKCPTHCHIFLISTFIGSNGFIVLMK